MSVSIKNRQKKPKKQNMKKIIIALLVIGTTIVACKKNPLTGRRQAKFFPESQMIGLSATVVILLIIGWIGWSQYELYQAKKAAQMEFAGSWQLPTDGLLIRTSMQKESILNHPEIRRRS